MAGQPLPTGDSEKQIETNPITAALPPSSDYITYLTILEYQLTADRLSTLTGHLAEDDGTLAKEIGWDLLKLVLPLLDAAPDDAAKCLEVVSRRGNPREVVVRVAEALETLGADDNDEDSGPGQDLAGDELPTFEGEAQRIHLGKMNLSEAQTSSATDQDANEASQEKEHASTSTNSLHRKLCSLLSMLGDLHPRIKTQYPSRFLATSLPAALGAYRRIPITFETTFAFLTLLGKLSGKQRPVLPPRSSAASVARMQANKASEPTVFAPLPDPEGGSAENAKSPTDLENSIVLRLLQAVLLEVLEEFLVSNPNTMEWAARLLEKQNPSKAIPDRQTRTQAWQDDEVLKAREAAMRKFLDLADELSLKAEDVFRSTHLRLVRRQGPEVAAAAGSDSDEDKDEEPTDYPRSPSQIPYSHLGTLFLFLASLVPAIIEQSETRQSMEMSTPELHRFVNQFVLPTPTIFADHPIPSVAHNSPAAIDALLAFLIIERSLSSSPMKVQESSSSEDDYSSLIKILSYLSAEHPEPSFRGSAYYLATTFTHNHPWSNFRLAIIKMVIRESGAFEPLKEVAIGWLKEEFLSTLDSTRENQSSSTDQDGNIFTSSILFSYDEELSALLFPDIPTAPLSSDAGVHTELEVEEPGPSPDSTPLGLTLPIASLNLLFLLLTNHDLKRRFNLGPKILAFMPSPSEHSPIRVDLNPRQSLFETRAAQFVTTLQNYVDTNAGTGAKEEEGRLSLLGLAVGRVIGALERTERDLKDSAASCED